MIITEKHSQQEIEIDVELLVAELKASVEGEVRFDDGSRALYSTDSSNYRQVPIGVVVPKTEQDILNTVALCNKYKAPVLSRGGGTSLAGQCCNVAVVMDMTKYYNQILHIDPDKKLARVQPGIVLDELRYATEKYGLTFGPDPSTHTHCAIGGMMGNNSCGVHSVMASQQGLGARTSDNTETLTVLTYDGLKMEVGPTSEEELEKIIQAGGRKGEIYSKLRDLRDKYADLIREKFPKIPRRVSGYNLDELLPENGFNVARALAGTEGTCVVYLDATVKLIDNPHNRSLVVLGYPDVYSAGQHAPFALKHKPIGLEGIDEKLIDFMRNRGLDLNDISLLPAGQGWLMVEFGGNTQQEADDRCRALMEDLKKVDNPPTMSLFDIRSQEQQLWRVREAGLGATAFVSYMADTWEGWEDAAVPPDKVGEYLRDFRKLLDKYDYDTALYGHFGQGCIHCRIDFDLVTQPGIDKYKHFTEEAARLVVSYGGSISGEHGDGQSKADLLEIMFGKELVQAFNEFKAIWDPDWKMNPGKVVDPYGQKQNLRLGADYSPEKPKTYFQYPTDEGLFSRAVLRCVGVGQCRRHEGGTMCPSYMVTREEEHSTRGRARLLFEMLQGQEIDTGWKSESVKEALDLCLACKGCKGDCPVHVDMATYKSEFLSHYYEGRLRPRTAYAFGWIYWWARLASHIPELVNFLTQNPITGSIAKLLAGVSQKRQIPQFAERTFRDWYSDNRREDTGKPRVILWADTFNNFFKPQTLVAGKEVLEAAGFNVVVPEQMLCCGRPLYDFGMLKTAKRLLLDILDALREDIRKGTPVVGLEPSCTAVFRDELCNLFPADEDAKRLKKQTYTLGEFLTKLAPDFEVPELKRTALVHGHCHHKAIMKLKGEEQVLQHMKLDFQVLDSGCCGMAGYFGYEAGRHYEVGLAAGERVLLPAVRKADKETLIVADGFSCREQIEQGTNRRAMHLAQVLQMALREQHQPSHEDGYPEKKYVEQMQLSAPPAEKSRRVVVLAAVSALFFFSLLVLDCLKDKEPLQ
ncbi:FAD-binding and (Fe-S)-binding domain-containing protein [Pontibacter flavimaris]|uniref:Dimethylmenaquinone methyltransferase n=1 Tax=Pontibacter flavimaris TaxID=1797110 RepID=A0A1Q5P882_9BACT|nr:FAD-binding and (Fe-S)-binding domain-containing protein [Pontibacter flavimaris]OKL38485.1 dimethylmenaquinone methyltransferase [Pontibacter flavimaris]